jgi:hypothetical protein
MEKCALLRPLWVVATLTVAACGDDSSNTTQPPADSGTDATSADAAGDTGTGLIPDAGGDSGIDGTVPTDAATDATSDAKTTEAGHEAGTEAGAEAGAHEAGTEAGAEAGMEAGAEAGPEAGADAGSVCGYTSTILADHPLAYLKLDEAAGTTATDQTGNGNTGTYKGGFTLGAPGAIASCPGDTAATLDGTAGWIDLGDKFGFTNATPFSLEIWINPSSITGEFRGLLTKGFNTDTNGKRQGYDTFSVDGLQWGTALGFERWQAGNAGFAGVGPNGTDAGGAAAPVVGTWMHVVAVYDGTNQMLYTNGALTAGPAPSSEMIPTLAGCSFAVGALWCGTQGFFAGTVDEVAVYGTALSAAQVQAHYQAAQVGSGVVVLTPANNATVSGPVLFQVTASESVVINQVQLWDNGKKLGAYSNTNSGATWQYFTQSYPLSILSSGAHTTTVMDLDNSYNVIHQTVVNYTVQ